MPDTDAFGHGGLTFRSRLDARSTRPEMPTLRSKLRFSVVEGRLQPLRKIAQRRERM